MSKNTVERCDCCGKVVAETGFKGDSESIYRRRVKLWEWVTGSWLGWRLIEAEWQTLCGECWDAIGETVRRQSEQTKGAE